MKKKSKKPRDRRHEVVCRCSAYRFPHRMFGGKCDGAHLPREGYGSQECRTCTLHENGYCEVIEEQEKAIHCPIVDEFIAYNEVKIWNPKLKKGK